MVFEPFAHAARTAPLFVPGLPAAKAFAVNNNPLTASTQTDISGLAQSLAVPVVQIKNARIVRNKFDGVSILIDLFTSYADAVNLSGIEKIAQNIVAQMGAMSRGPLSLAELRRRGHPYGRNAAGLMRGKLGHGYGSVSGVYGSAPNLAIVNQQSQGAEALANSWGYQLLPRQDGVTVEIFNTAPESWWTAAGTRLMQAHGPETYVIAMFRSQLLTEWRRSTLAAYHRTNALSMTMQTIQSAEAL